MIKKTLLVSGFLAMIFACEKDDNKVDTPTDEHEEELITSVDVEVQHVGSETTNTYSFKDLDGPGGNEPTQLDTIYLIENSRHDVSLSFLNESENPAENITAEISEEADEHIICFESSNGDVIVNRSDSDGTYEIGLESTWTSSNAGSVSSMTITLKHQGTDKDGTCTPGETDVEVVFPVKILGL